jgi:hypothetical protein
MHMSVEQKRGEQGNSQTHRDIYIYIYVFPHKRVRKKKKREELKGQEEGEGQRAATFKLKKGGRQQRSECLPVVVLFAQAGILKRDSSRGEGEGGRGEEQQRKKKRTRKIKAKADKP